MLIASLFIALQTVSVPVAPCAHDREALMAMSPERFDSTEVISWRTLANDQTCLAVAANLLRDYRESHRAVLDISQLHLNYWHEGQLRAGLGQTARAVRLMMAGVDPSVTSDGFADYALGSVAFLNRDLVGLKTARDRLAATPPPEDWDEAVAEFRAKFGREIAWPMNLDVLDGLITCFDKPYLEAYGDASCRP